MASEITTKLESLPTEDYNIKGKVLFPTQVAVTKGLDGNTHGSGLCIGFIHRNSIKVMDKF